MLNIVRLVNFAQPTAPNSARAIYSGRLPGADLSAVHDLALLLSLSGPLWCTQCQALLEAISRTIRQCDRLVEGSPCLFKIVGVRHQPLTRSLAPSPNSGEKCTLADSHH